MLCFVAEQTFSRCGEWGLFFIVVGGLVAEYGLWGFSSGSTWAQSWHTGPVAPWYVASSQPRDGIGVLCIGRQILNNWTTREAQQLLTLSEHLLYASIVLSTLHKLTWLFLTPTPQSTIAFVPIIRMKKLRHQEFKWLALGHEVSDGEISPLRWI